MEIKGVGVVGGGLMGSGIAQTCARSGYQVVVSETSETLLSKGLASINGSLSKSVGKGKLAAADKDAIFGRIKGTLNTADFATCDLVVEAVVKNVELKKKVFAELDRVCPRDTILATNTSCLSVIDVANAAKLSDKMLGLHFFNSVPLMKLMELVRTIATSEGVFATGKRFGESLGKAVVATKDPPGFILNRLSIAFTLSAVRMLDAGVANREDIDTAVNLGLNHPMGPLPLADFLGLDTFYFVANSLYQELSDPQYAPPHSAQEDGERGWLGRRPAKGFTTTASPSH